MSIVLSERRERSFVTKRPAELKDLSASVELGGRLFRAQYSFSRERGLSPVLSRTASSLLMHVRISFGESDLRPFLLEVEVLWDRRCWSSSCFVLFSVAVLLFESFSFSFSCCSFSSSSAKSRTYRSLAVLARVLLGGRGRIVLWLSLLDRNVAGSSRNHRSAEMLSRRLSSTLAVVASYSC